MKERKRAKERETRKSEGMERRGRQNEREQQSYPRRRARGREREGREKERQRQAEPGREIRPRDCVSEIERKRNGRETHIAGGYTSCRRVSSLGPR